MTAEENNGRFSGDEESVRRLASAIEQIRDHFCPKQGNRWKKVCGYLLKAVAICSSYAVIIRAVDWYCEADRSEKLAARCSDVAMRLFYYEGDAVGASHFLVKAKELDSRTFKYRLELGYVKSMTTITDLFGLTRPLTADERARVDAALAEAMFLLEAAPDEPMSHALAAQAYALLGAKDEALASAARAVSLAPEVPVIRVCACQACYTVGDRTAARRHVEEASRLKSQHPLLLFWKGFLALSEDHDVSAARASFEQMTQKAPRLALSYAALGQAILKEKEPDFKAADAAFRKSLELDPAFYSAMLGLGEIAMRTGDRPVARIWYDSILRQDPNSIKALEARAQLNGRDDDWKAAIADWTAAIALAPFRADLYRERAVAYASAKDEAHAAADREIAAKLER